MLPTAPRFIALSLALSLGVAACRPIEFGIETPGAVEAVVATQVAATLEAVPAATVTPAGPAEAALLPAPVNFLTGGQIWRLERDGSRVTPVTFEAAPVTAFSVSAADGRLAYVSGNSLYTAAADGQGRAELITGPRTFGDEQVNRELTNPQWSPDGRRIAFGLNGVNVIDGDGGAARLILASDSADAATAQFYRPLAWSPQGSRLLVEARYMPHGGRWQVLDLADGSRVDILPPEGQPCCDPVWSRDGQSIYFANALGGLIAPGLWRASADDGAVTTLINGFAAGTATAVRAPQEFDGGRLRFFLGNTPDVPDQALPLAMVEAGFTATGLGEPTALGGAALPVGDILWDPAGRGAVVVQLEATAAWPPPGRLMWVPSDGGATVELFQAGADPQWAAP
mgnify:CR=1 FL=1